MKAPDRPIRMEPRWPVAVAILAVIGLLTFLPERISLFAHWVGYAAATVIIASMTTAVLASEKRPWLRVEHAIVLFFIVVAETGTLITLVMLVRRMLYPSSEIGGLQLLASSTAVWVNNVLAFSLLYWRVDRGGPEARMSNSGKRPDWLFPQTGVPEEAPPGWRPAYVDYLFLAFSTATAFSTTDVMPLTPRAKLLMMFESTVSLATLVLVAARAINILGS